MTPDGGYLSLRQAISDPGSYVTRNEGESVSAWAERAVLTVLGAAICGASGNYGAFMEPLACAYPKGHDGPHAWASLPTFVNGEVAALLAEPILSDWALRYWARHSSMHPMLSVTIEDYRDRVRRRISDPSQETGTDEGGAA